ncbi:hypothetical protein FDA94_29435 [Herbidospora galbida]|uniref:Uncharacterized protein n=1 Tax=Herbidospora galbida TaxID=2575442 RepID=A0A4U3M6D0_9ACTN|nr:hypothetical protein [Herbidospora galbida]TKK84465.1 hypothetical protein FDA94_29435 [Herbidospora galbida]
MPKSRGRKGKTTRTPKRAGNAASGAGGSRFTPGRLRSDDGQLGQLLVADGIPADTRVVMLLPMLWLSKAHGHRGNICLDACLTLRHAYRQLGITAELQPVKLTVTDATGRVTVYGAAQPHWENDNFIGHVVLYLPGAGRLVDATVEQYPQIAKLRVGPVIGRLAAGSQPIDPQQDRLPARAQLVVPRGDLLLTYTAVADTYVDEIRNADRIEDTERAHYEAGVRFASWALLALREPGVINRVKQAPFPRLQALLDLLANAPEIIDESIDEYRFALPSPDGALVERRLDEITLPAGI